jgi:hypothetical protein
MTGHLLRIIGGVGATIATASVVGTVVIAGGGANDSKGPADRSALPLSEVVLPASSRGSDPSDRRGTGAGRQGDERVEDDAASSGTNDAGDDSMGIDVTLGGNSGTDSPSNQVSSTRNGDDAQPGADGPVGPRPALRVPQVRQARGVRTARQV